MDKTYKVERWDLGGVYGRYTLILQKDKSNEGGVETLSRTEQCPGISYEQLTFFLLYLLTPAFGPLTKVEVPLLIPHKVLLYSQNLLTR